VRQNEGVYVGIVKNNRPLVAGNWKMNGLKNAVQEIIKLQTSLQDLVSLGCDVLVCPPATLLSHFEAVVSEGQVPLLLGGQDCHMAVSGAHTGDISAQMLKDVGCEYVIVGHSERRSDHNETNEMVQAKAKAAIEAGLIPIICVGESEEERVAGQTLTVVTSQLRGSVPPESKGNEIIIAYEPVWAIGTGKVPEVKDVADVHQMIRKELASILGHGGQELRILYGGSVKADNAGTLMAIDNVDGALVGGASLRADDFTGILKVYSS